MYTNLTFKHNRKEAYRKGYKWFSSIKDVQEFYGNKSLELDKEKKPTAQDEQRMDKTL